MSAATIAERVAAGAAYLDEHDPEWWRADVERAINLGKLDMATGDVCVLGQRCPLETLERYLGYAIEDDDEREFGYHAYATRLNGGFSDREDMETWAVAHGFNRPFGNLPSEYDDLTAEWKRVITDRRATS